MKEKEIKSVAIPSMEEIQTERKRLRYKSRYNSVLKSTMYTLVVVAAFAVLAATLWLPFLHIYGTSMTPTLQDGEIVVCLKTSDFEPGDIVAFYYNNKILVKRVIATTGQWVDIDEAGNVSVDNMPLDEPYVSEKAKGECDLKLPYQVPDGRVFVMGDHRRTSIDSRHSTIGCVAQEQVVGKIFLRLWPLTELQIF